MSPSSRVRSITFLAVLTLLTACAGTPEPAPLERPIRVLLLGDSISIGYTQHVRELMGDAAHVVRPTNARGGAENCAGTTKGIDHVDRWLALEGGGWDVIHFNFGLHDLKRVKPDTGKNSQDPADPRQAGRPVYRAQLREITAKLYGTGARLVFATTTPFPPGVKPWRDPEDAVRYNRVALEVMGEFEGVAVDDLYAFALPRLDEIQQPVNVHFTKEGSRVLAEEVVRSIEAAAGWRSVRVVGP